MSAGLPVRALKAVGRERLIVLVLAAICCAALITLKTMKITEYYGDTAIFFQLAENISERGAPVSQVFANTQAFLDSGLLTMAPDQLAKDPLRPPAAAERNVLTFHAYFILYPIALFVRFLPPNVVFMSLWVLSYVGMVVLAYLFLRRHALPVVAALLFCLLIVTHPAWADGLLSGQFYPDRLFVFFGFLLMLLATKKNIPRGWFIAAAVVCAAINERAAITAGIFLLAYVLLFWKTEKQERLFKFAVACGLLAYGTLLVKVFITNAYYSTFMPTSAGQVIALFHDPVFAQKAALFGLVNAAFLIVALFNVRAAAIAALLMVPNVVGNIGGAEKIGWVTHYHSYYLPALIWAAMMGYQTAYRKAARPAAVAGFYGLACAAIVFVSFVNPYSPAPVDIGPANVSNHFLVKAQQQMSQWFGPQGKTYDAIPARIRQIVPPGSVISTTEQLMPILYENRIIRTLPVDIDRANFAGLLYTMDGGKVVYSGVPSYLPPDGQKQVTAAILARMKRDGYDLGHPTLVPELGVAIVKRALPKGAT